MGTEQTWEIVATPHDRWCIEALLLADGLLFKTRKEQKQVHRARLALDLYPLNQTFFDGRQGRVPLADDRTTYRRFKVTAETGEVFIECCNKIEKGLSSGVTAGLEPILQQLEDQSHAADQCALHPEAPDGPVTEDWSRSTAPLLDNPARLVDEIAAIMRACKAAGYDVKVLVDRFLEESEPPKPSKDVPGRATGGHLTAQALSAPPS
jgi:hypothetical protein